MDSNSYIKFISNKLKERVEFYLKDQAMGLARILFSRFCVEFPGECQLLEFRDTISLQFKSNLSELGINIDKSKLTHPNNIRDDNIIIYPTSANDLIIIGNEIYSDI